MKTASLRRLLSAAWVGSACLVAAAPLCVVAGCEAKISADTYASIQPGMTLHDVERILGGKGERQEVSGVSISGAGIGSSSSSGPEVWVWKASGKEVSVTMSGGKVVSVSKAGF